MNVTCGGGARRASREGKQRLHGNKCAFILVCARTSSCAVKKKQKEKRKDGINLENKHKHKQAY